VSTFNTFPYGREKKKKQSAEEKGRWAIAFDSQERQSKMEEKEEKRKGGLFLIGSLGKGKTILGAQFGRRGGRQSGG